MHLGLTLSAGGPGRVDNVALPARDDTGRVENGREGFAPSALRYKSKLIRLKLSAARYS